MPKAYSYLRFSTPEQAAGDSFRRQTAMAEAYAKQHGLELDEELTFRDLGVSAFRGANAETGALGAFLEAVRDDLVEPGSVLLVEALDRISRRTARKAVRVLEEIVEAGVDVVTLNDGQRYTLESLDGFNFLMAILLLIRGHEESLTKSKRLRAAWSAKRAELWNGKALTAIAPAWIDATKGERPKLDLERSKIVHRIFDMFLQGLGKQKIADTLDAERIPTFGRAAKWHKSYIQKILTNPAVVGRFIPHELIDAKRVPLEPVDDYYPRAIKVETWRRAQALLKSSSKTKAKKGAVQNMLAGLAKCPKCGGTMTRVMKGARSKPKLVCVSAKSGVRDFDGSNFCTYHSVPLEAVELALTRNADLFAELVPARDPELQDKIDGVRSELEVTLTGIDNFLAVLEEKHSNAIASRLRTLEAKADKLRADLDELNARAAQSDSKLVARRAERLTKALSAGPVDKAAANAALRECFSRIVVDYEDGDLRCTWRHTPQDLTLVYDAGFTPIQDLAPSTR